VQWSIIEQSRCAVSYIKREVRPPLPGRRKLKLSDEGDLRGLQLKGEKLL